MQIPGQPRHELGEVAKMIMLRNKIDQFSLIQIQKDLN